MHVWAAVEMLQSYEEGELLMSVHREQSDALEACYRDSTAPRSFGAPRPPRPSIEWRSTRLPRTLMTQTRCSLTFAMVSAVRRTSCTASSSWRCSRS
jgi:hypothetical protein